MHDRKEIHRENFVSFSIEYEYVCEIIKPWHISERLIRVLLFAVHHYFTIINLFKLFLLKRLILGKRIQMASMETKSWHTVEGVHLICLMILKSSYFQWRLQTTRIYSVTWKPKMLNSWNGKLEHMMSLFHKLNVLNWYFP